jgi:DNA-directed RNA polymerase sigma subunit (sigma70/sigma32)
MTANSEDIKEIFTKNQTRLNQRERQIFGMYHGVDFEGKKHPDSEICLEFGINHDQLRRVLNRARKKLRD